MDYNTLKRRLAGITKGAFTPILWEKPLKTRKEFINQVITKRTSGVVRFGVEYENIKAVQSARIMGAIPPVNSGLPWGEWDEYPYFIKHNNQKYLRVATVPSTKFKTEYFLNGLKVEKSMIENMCLKSEFSDKATPLVFTLKTDNILALG